MDVTNKTDISGNQQNLADSRAGDVHYDRDVSRAAWEYEKILEQPAKLRLYISRQFIVKLGEVQPVTTETVGAALLRAVQDYIVGNLSCWLAVRLHRMTTQATGIHQ